MIKKYWNISLHEYDVVERTGEISHLKAEWNILPTILFKGRISQILEKLRTEINETGANDNLETERWKVRSLLKINLLESCYLGLIATLGLQVKTKGLGLIYKRVNKKVKVNGESVKKYIRYIREHFDIKVGSIEDLEKVHKKLELLKNKYNENFGQAEPTEPTKQQYLMDIALGVYTYLGQTLNPKEQTVLNFISNRERALMLHRRITTKKKNEDA